MRRVRKNLSTAALDSQHAIDEPITDGGRNIRFRIVLRADVVAKDLKSASIEVIDPTLDWNFPV
jgi:hypothetical protein